MKKGLKIKVIGAGGIGSWLVDPLCAYLSYAPVASVDLTVIDGDTYEERNRERQNFGEIGPKAEITASRLRGQYDRLNVKAKAVYLREGNIAAHIKEGDIVAVCVDNHKVRKLISDRACELQNVTVVSGGNDYYDGNVLVHVRRDGKNVTLPVCNEYHPEMLNPIDRNPGDEPRRKKALGCAALLPSEPQLVVTNFAIASVMLNALYKCISGHEKWGTYNEVYTDVTLNQSKAMLRAERPRTTVRRGAKATTLVASGKSVRNIRAETRDELGLPDTGPVRIDGVLVADDFVVQPGTKEIEFLTRPPRKRAA